MYTVLYIKVPCMDQVGGSYYERVIPAKIILRHTTMQNFLTA